MALIVTATLPLLTITDKETINKIIGPPRNTSHSRTKKSLKKSAHVETKVNRNDEANYNYQNYKSIIFLKLQIKLYNSHFLKITKYNVDSKIWERKISYDFME